MITINIHSEKLNLDKIPNEILKLIIHTITKENRLAYLFISNSNYYLMNKETIRFYSELGIHDIIFENNGKINTLRKKGIKLLISVVWALIAKFFKQFTN